MQFGNFWITSVFFLFSFQALVANALVMPTSPFCYCPMPTFSSCDNTQARDLKRYIVKHKPFTHAAIQTLHLTRLTRCQDCDDRDSHTFLLCAKGRGGQSNGLMQTDWQVFTVHNTVHAWTHRNTCAH